MNDRELTPEERIEQLEKEKAAQEKDEAMQIFMITSMNAVIPPFLRR